MSYANSCPVDCAYRSRPQSNSEMNVTCDFILIEGHSRGCDPEPYCKCYRKRGQKTEKKPGQMPPLLNKSQERKPWNYEKGFRLYKLGMTTKQIAAELNVGVGAVHGRRQRCWSKGRP